MPSITAAHADLFVPADRAISPPTGKFISPHHSRGTFTINRPRKHSSVLNSGFSAGPPLTWLQRETGKNRIRPLARTQKHRLCNKCRANIKSCFCIKVQMSWSSTGKAKLTHCWKEYYLKIRSMFSPQHQDLLREIILPYWSTFLDVYQGAMLTDRISLALVPYKSLKWNGCMMMYPNGWNVVCP